MSFWAHFRLFGQEAIPTPFLGKAHGTYTTYTPFPPEREEKLQFTQKSRRKQAMWLSSTQ